MIVIPYMQGTTGNPSGFGWRGAAILGARAYSSAASLSDTDTLNDRSVAGRERDATRRDLRATERRRESEVFRRHEQVIELSFGARFRQSWNLLKKPRAITLSADSEKAATEMTWSPEHDARAPAGGLYIAEAGCAEIVAAGHIVLQIFSALERPAAQADHANMSSAAAHAAARLIAACGPDMLEAMLDTVRRDVPAHTYLHASEKLAALAVAMPQIQAENAAMEKSVQPVTFREQMHFVLSVGDAALAPVALPEADKPVTRTAPAYDKVGKTGASRQARAAATAKTRKKSAAKIETGIEKAAPAQIGQAVDLNSFRQQRRASGKAAVAASRMRVTNTAPAGSAKIIPFVVAKRALPATLRQAAAETGESRPAHQSQGPARPSLFASAPFADRMREAWRKTPSIRSQPPAQARESMIAESVVARARTAFHNLTSGWPQNAASMTARNGTPQITPAPR